jgi:hypothetical protein
MVEARGLTKTEASCCRTLNGSLAILANSTFRNPLGRGLTGDVLTLAIARTGSAPGDFVGVDLRIEAEVVPEAGSLIIWILTIACAVVFYSRRRLIIS